jgi:acetyl-CoA acetyltransferase
MAQLMSGLFYDIPLVTVNRRCCSGLQAVANIASSIRAGILDVGLAGGESMTMYDMASAFDFKKFSYMETGGWLHGGAMSQRYELYALEESSFWKRCCWRDGRSMDIAVTTGAEEEGPPVVHWETCARAAERWRDSTST